MHGHLARDPEQGEVRVVRTVTLRQLVSLPALLSGITAAALSLPASAQQESVLRSAPPTPTPAAQVAPATPTIAVPTAAIRLLDRYAQAIATEDLQSFEACFWQGENYVLQLKEVLQHFSTVRLKYLQLEARRGAGRQQLILKVRMQTRFRENRTRKPGQYELQVEFFLEQHRDEWRIRSIDPASEAEP